MEFLADRDRFEVVHLLHMYRAERKKSHQLQDLRHLQIVRWFHEVLQENCR